jgi:hypothetical protein
MLWYSEMHTPNAIITVLPCRQNIYHDKVSLSCGQVEQSVDIRFHNGFLYCSQGDAFAQSIFGGAGFGDAEP